MKLKCKIPGKIAGMAYGSASLKALQNENIPVLELFVREAIQNSSDASCGFNAKSCGINFNSGNFDVDSFCQLFDNDEDNARENFGDVIRNTFEEDADFLEIRDYETSGLTGAVCYGDVDKYGYGNYIKLVFDTGKGQTCDGEYEYGGSWGYGKSVYFRLGIGLVIFYTQIAKNDGYESRLIISLVEDEQNNNSLLSRVKGSNNVGRAWWGAKPTEDAEGTMLPIVDDVAIKEILSIFGLKPFPCGQTGTSIIIPFINVEKLLSETKEQADTEQERNKYNMLRFTDDMGEYIKYAVQKWYAPRIFNKHLNTLDCGQKWLKIRVNDTPICYEDMYPVFQMIQELYTTALSRGEYCSEMFRNIKYKEISSMRIEDSKAGGIAALRLTLKDLYGHAQGLSPFDYLLRDVSNIAHNDPVVMFARAPGMILDYKTSGNWTKNMHKSDNPEEYTFVFYVPEWNSKLKEDSNNGKYAGCPLGEYMRITEKSDHMEWTDQTPLKIVSNLKLQVINKTNALYADESRGGGNMSNRLSDYLGKKLLPRHSFGMGSRDSASEHSSSSVSNGLKLTFEKKGSYGDLLDIKFCANFCNNKKNAEIEMYVVSETACENKKRWKENIKTAFPFKILSIKDCQCVQNNISTEIVGCCTAVNKISNDISEISLVTDESACGFKIRNTTPNIVVSGTLQVKTIDRKYCLTLIGK